ncbi:unnamed protein product [Chrysoparadoxa australica]
MNRERLVVKRLEMKDQDAEDLRKGLTNKSRKIIPPKIGYDEVGSIIYEKMTELPHYYLTRLEAELLKEHAGDIAKATGNCEILELGSGSSSKTTLLLDAYEKEYGEMRYLPTDVSEKMLIGSAERLLERYPKTLSCHCIVGTFVESVAEAPKLVLPNRMIAFLGSTLGNMVYDDSETLACQLANSMAPGEFFLVGIDLQKDVSVILDAYTGPSAEVQSQFSINHLTVMNRRFGGNFNLEDFRITTEYLHDVHHVEMYIESLKEQVVTLKGLDLELQFSKGEKMRQLISRKFDLQDTYSMLKRCNLNVVMTFKDANEWYGLLLCQKE